MASAPPEPPISAMSELDINELYENAPCGYISLLPSGRIIKVNRTLLDWIGFSASELVEIKKFQDLLNIAGKIYFDTHFAPLLQMQGFLNEVALDLVCKDGSRLPALVNSKEKRDPSGAAGLIHITIFNAADRRRYERELLEARRSAEQAKAEIEHLNATLEQRVADEIELRLQAEASVRQSQKMEAVGQLTGGLAHDFNNLLTGISGNLEMISTRVAQGRTQGLDRYITAAQGASKRAAALTHRLLAFSRRQTLDPKATNVNRLVTGLEELIRRTVGPQIQIEVVGAVGLWPALVDPNQLENALLNLCINARDAMPDGGRLTIETGNRWLDDRTARERDIEPGQYLSLCVSDTGVGMSTELIARAFDPFFTTKPSGLGTGLGLSMVYGFAKQSGGQVRIYSEVGQGTMVCIYLPRHRGAEDVDSAVELPSAPSRVGQGETVLIIDDEPTVRVLVTEVLEEFGYTAIEAADGTVGLRILQSDIRVDLLVTDVGLPGGLNGRQVADAGRALRPDLKVLFITGYAENAVVGNGHIEPGMQVLTKPFAMQALADRIKNMLTRS